MIWLNESTSAGQAADAVLPPDFQYFISLFHYVKSYKESIKTNRFILR